MLYFILSLRRVDVFIIMKTWRAYVGLVSHPPSTGAVTTEEIDVKEEYLWHGEREEGKETLWAIRS